jgi:hypothetical protein
LQQIGSLGTLVAAGSGKDGLFTSGIQLGKDIFAGLKNYLPEPDPTIPGSIPRTPDEIKTSDDLGSFPG